MSLYVEAAENPETTMLPAMTRARERTYDAW
jgi:hypothetical protein